MLIMSYYVNIKFVFNVLWFSILLTFCMNLFLFELLQIVFVSHAFKINFVICTVLYTQYF